ncbi:unnamed protein product [Caenorhabditis auriculariae]|uniref:Apple domain-containing protein n=1 Tax=Caenorhabditis auriculariae TaxID=2777116 RepID=A0A8S1GXC2_9PELO|nr:unnamed protein product [Caenorhabditis auriculariae]
MSLIPYKFFTQSGRSHSEASTYTTVSRLQHKIRHILSSSRGNWMDSAQNNETKDYDGDRPSRIGHVSEIPTLLFTFAFPFSFPAFFITHLSSFQVMAFLLLLLVLLIPVDSSSVSFRNCFKRIPRRSVDNDPPIAEYRRESVSSCMKHCIMAAGNKPKTGSTCKSFTFDPSTMTCRLYDHNGNKVPAIIHPAIGTDFYQRISDVEDCAGPIVGQKINHNFVMLRSDFKNKPQKSILETPKKELSNGDLPEAEMDDFLLKSRALSAPIVKANNRDVLRSIPTGQNIEEMTQPIEEEACGTTMGYYVVVGNEIAMSISDGDVKVYNGVEQGNCANFCSQNQGPDGEKIKCRSLNYFPLDHKCELYSILAEPHGTGNLLQNDKVIYAEKFCLPDAKIKCQKDEIFILHAQKTISKRRIGASEAVSVSDCLSKCISNPKCQSSVLNSEKKTCELFDVSPSSVELVEDAPPATVLIENGCYHSSPVAQSFDNSQTERSEWSDCSFKVNGKPVKTRTSDGVVEVKEC